MKIEGVEGLEGAEKPGDYKYRAVLLITRLLQTKENTTVRDGNKYGRITRYFIQVMLKKLN